MSQIFTNSPVPTVPERTRARLTVAGFDPVPRSGTLTGFATVEIPEFDLRIRAAIHSSAAGVGPCQLRLGAAAGSLICSSAIPALATQRVVVALDGGAA